jgi:hypothetical protein
MKWQHVIEALVNGVRNARDYDRSADEPAGWIPRVDLLVKRGDEEGSFSIDLTLEQAQDFARRFGKRVRITIEEIEE